MIAWRFSVAPFGEPGRVTMMVLLRTPAAGRDIMATGMLGLCVDARVVDLHGVTARELESIAWANPGACLCNNGVMAYVPISIKYTYML